jgi:hypothetical protein
MTPVRTVPGQVDGGDAPGERTKLDGVRTEACQREAASERPGRGTLIRACRDVNAPRPAGGSLEALSRERASAGNATGPENDDCGTNPDVIVPRRLSRRHQITGPNPSPSWDQLA